MTAPLGANANSTGAIYDLGYQRYAGARLGRGAAVRALIVHSLRSAFGIGRGSRAKIGPFALLAVSVVPAILQVGIASVTGNMLEIFFHETYFQTVAMIFALFCAGQAPELVGGDRQNRVLTLYFSRSLRPLDYALAKYAALVIALLIVGWLPHAILFLGRAFTAEDVLGAIALNSHLIIPILVSGAAIALMFAAVSLGIASLTTRRTFATVGILGVLLLLNGLVAGLVQANPGGLRYSVLTSPLLVGDGLTRWLFDAPHPRRSILGRAALEGHIYLFAAIVIVLVTTSLLVWRYRRIDP
jgi:ABC-2 type transport system permease protein